VILCCLCPRFHSSTILIYFYGFDVLPVWSFGLECVFDVLFAH
jgi:hypothetical protein